MKNHTGMIFLVAAVLAGGCAGNPEVVASEHIRKGDAFKARNEIAQALVEYQSAVQATPLSGQAHLKLADAFLERGNVKNALREYVRAADLLPDDIDVQVKAGSLLLAARLFDDAQARASRALSKNPRHVEALILRANALAGLNQIGEAIAEVERAIASDPDQVLSYASLGQMQYAGGNKERAESAFLNAVKVDPKSITARLALANFYRAVGRQDDAAREFEAALVLDPADVLANRAMAYFYLSTRRLAEAEPYFKSLAASPKAPGAGLTLAGYYLVTGRWPDAERVLQEVVATDPKNAATAKIKLAYLKEAAGDFKTARQLVNEVLAGKPTDPEALASKAELDAREGNLDQALTAVNAAIQADSSSAFVRFIAGKVHLLRRDEGHAREEFAEALRLDPRMARAQFELAKLDVAAGKLDDAEAMARAASSALGTSADLRLLIARIDRLKGRNDRALEPLRALAAQVPNSAEVQTELGLVELGQKNRAAARTAFEKALKINPQATGALSGLVRMDVEDKRPEDAKARVQKARQAAPKNPEILLIESGLAGAFGDAARAESAAREAAELDPNNIEAFAQLSRLYLMQKRIPEAITQIEEATKRQPKSVALHTTVGVLYEIQGKLDLAKAAYEKALAIDAGAAVAANNLAWVMSQTGGNLEIALQLAGRAITKLPEQPEFNDTIGWIYHLKKLDSMAVRSLEKAVAKDARNPSYHYHLGVAYAGIGDKTKARAMLNKALSLNPNFDAAADARRVLESLK